MAGVMFAAVLSLTAIRTCLVVDAAVIGTGGRQGGVSRVAHIVRSDVSRSVVRSSATSPRQAKGPTGGGASKVRSLHSRLLGMHFAGAVCQSAGIAKYMLPVSDQSCRFAHRAFIGMAVVFDACLVLFLLAKVHVTNGNRKLACWAKSLVWFTRVYGGGYLPLAAIVLGTIYPGSANEEETFCVNGITEDFTSTKEQNARSYLVSSLMMVAEFVLLLVMFVKPMLGRQGGTQSGGAVYRRIVLRNVVCTSCVVAAYTTTTIVVFLALLREVPEDNKASTLVDIAIAINQSVTLCVMEIALPLGFVSCWKECTRHLAESRVDENPKTCTPTKATPGNAAPKVVPVEMLSPSTP